MSYQYLMDIALILMSTKILGIIVRRFQMPQVVGALLAGLILGPAILNILHETNFINEIAELGVIVIMFTAGINTDIRDLKHTGKAGFIVAICGVIIPLIFGTGLAYLFNMEQTQSVDVLLQHIFLGVILTATSVSITVETLKELGKLSTKVGNTILAAALIDDILGLIALTIVTAMAGNDVNVLMVLGKIVLFFILISLVSYIAHKLLTLYCKMMHNKNLQRYSVAAFVLCLFMAYSAEHFFGIADIIGAFIAGLVIAGTPKAKYIASKFGPLSFLLLTPVFFASIGIKIDLPSMSWSLILFSISLVIVAILSKLFGCGLGAKLCGFKTKESVQVGFGMSCRGEVALIVANKGYALGLLSASIFGPVVIMVVSAAILTPILLKIVFYSNGSTYQQSNLVDNYEKKELLDYVEQKILYKNHVIK